MAAFTDYMEALVLNWLRGTAMPAPPTVYVGVFSVAPGETGGGTEVTTTIRPAGRIAAGFGPVTAGGTIANAAEVSFGAAAGAAVINAFALFDAPTGGNMLAFASTAQALDVRGGITVSFATGDLTVSLD